MLAVFYDLAKAPPTYDFYTFLVAAEAERIRRGEAGMTVLIVPGPDGGFRKDRLPPDTAHRRVMLRNIVLQCHRLLPGAAVRLCESRDEARLHEAGDCFPDGYAVDAPKCRYGLKTLVEALSGQPRPSLRGETRLHELVAWRKPYVTITLREASYWPVRNGDKTVFNQAALWLAGQGVETVFVRDFEGNGPVPGLEDTAAATDIAARMALYECAAMNLFTINGPATLALATTHVPYRMFMDLDVKAPAISTRYYEKCGLPPGSQWPGRGPRQELIWARESVEGVTASLETTIKEMS